MTGLHRCGSGVVGPVRVGCKSGRGVRNLIDSGTPQQLRQDSLAKEKAKADRAKYIEDSIKAVKEKKPIPLKNSTPENVGIQKKNEDYQE